MIKNPFLILTILLSVEFSILYLARHSRTRHLFNFLPGLFWIYFLPMALSTCGFIDGQNPIYQKITTRLLPPALFLLLLTVDIKAIARLGKGALAMFFAGSFGIMLGMVAAFVLFKPIIGVQFWSGFGALAGSWTGGSANMIAVKEALGTPDAVFLPMVIVDTIVPYVWMGLLVVGVAWQRKYDDWNGCDRRILDDLARRAAYVKDQQSAAILPGRALGMIALALAAGVGAQKVSVLLPTVKEVISPYAWAIILVSTAGIILSLTPLSRVQKTGSSKIGYWILYFVLTAIGARASLHHMATAGILIMAGAVVVVIHMLVLLLVGRLLRAPLFLVATASQANVGGVASAPMVAEGYQPGLASVGLLLAVLGNIIGTYAGIITGQICRFFG